MADDDRVSLGSFEEARSVIDDDEHDPGKAAGSVTDTSAAGSYVAGPRSHLPDAAGLAAAGDLENLPAKVTSVSSPRARSEQSPSTTQIPGAVRAGDSRWVSGAGDDAAATGKEHAEADATSDEEDSLTDSGFGEGSEEEDEFFTRGRTSAHNTSGARGRAGAGTGSFEAAAAPSAPSASSSASLPVPDREAGKTKSGVADGEAGASAGSASKFEADAPVPAACAATEDGAGGDHARARDDARDHGPEHDGGDSDDADDDDDGYYADGAEAAAVGGAGAGPSADGGDEDEADESGAKDDAHGDGDAGRYMPDLVLPDGRILSRRPHPRSEADETADEKKDAAMAGAMKDEGNRHFTAGEHDTAAACYTEALRAVPRGPEFDEHRAVYYGNRAACHLAMVSIPQFACPNAMVRFSSHTIVWLTRLICMP